MSKVQLSGSEKRALILWVLAGVVGLWYAQRHFFEAFPEASVNFKVTRNEARERARNFVESLGNTTSGYRSVIVFGVNDNAKTYLERAVGLKEANRLMESELNVWHWSVRFFKPEQQEEFQVEVSPEGKVTGYSHIVPESRAGEEPTREAAQQTAQSFLTAKLGKPAADWDFLAEEASSTKKPSRLDWAFTWEKHGFKAKDAPERLRIELHGSDVGLASEALKVPEQWERDYQQLRATNTFLSEVAFVPYLLIMAAAFWVGIQSWRRGQSGWRMAIQVALVAAVLLTIMSLNGWPLDLYRYDTNSAYGAFAIKRVAVALAFGIFSALTIAFPLPGGEPLYRAARPQLLQLKNALTLRGLRTKEFFSACVVGLSLAATHMGLLVAFYLIANHFGAWSPQEVKYDDTLNTAIPWIGGLAIGLLAATSEEFLFRLFAIPFFKKYTKSTAVAVILPAFMWGFLHTAYPNEPPYIRGLEVGLIGIAAGFVMLRWGILATLVWHYTVDACLVGLLLIRSSSAYFKISGIVVGLVVLIPFAMAAYWRLRRGGFEEDADLLNAAAPVVEDSATVSEVERTEWQGTHTALSEGMIALLCGCVLAGGLLAWQLKTEKLGDFLKVSMNARQAETKAEEILRQRGVNPASFHHATTFVDASDGTANEYLRQKIGLHALNEIYEKKLPMAFWHVRFFANDPEEFSVVLKPDGSVHSLHHLWAENAKGSSLSKEEAVAKASAFLLNEKQIDLNEWTLVDSTSKKQPNRVDHVLVWQEKRPLDDPGARDPIDTNRHAFERIQVQVLGDEVTSYRVFVQIPDEWRRKHDQQSVVRTLMNFLPLLLAVGGAGFVLVSFLRQIKSEAMKRVPWKRLARFSLWGLLAYLLVIAFGDRIAEFMSQAPTTVPFKMFAGGLGIGLLVGTLFYFGVFLLLFAMGWFFVQEGMPDTEIPRWFGMPRIYYRDALLIGLGGTCALVGLGRVTQWAQTHWPTPHQALGTTFGSDFAARLPAAAVGGDTLLHSLLMLGVIGVTAGFVTARCKSSVLRIIMFVLASLALVGGWGSGADFASQWVRSALLLALIVFGVARVVRLNLLGYFLALAISSLLLGAQDLLSQPNTFYRQQGYIVLAMLAALLIWPLVAWLAGSRRPPHEPSTAGDTPSAG